MIEHRSTEAAGADDLGESFARSMHAAYGDDFTANEIREHAAICERRGTRVCHVELWRSLPEGLSAFCLVADDRPGLLSHICKIFAARDFDVLSARVYCRRREGGLPLEAFDLFWVRARRDATPVGVRMAELLSHELERVLRAASQSTLPPPGQQPRHPSSHESPRVYFNTNALRRGEYVLVVEALDRPGLLLAISSALHRAGVQVLASDVRTEGRVIRDCFEIADPSAAPLSSERLAAVRQSVVNAVRQRSHDD